MLYLGLVSTALAVYFWNKVFELLDATVASLLLFAQPVVGALLSAWLLGEPLGVQFFLGGALVLAGLLLVSVPNVSPHPNPLPAGEKGTRPK